MKLFLFALLVSISSCLVSVKMQRRLGRNRLVRAPGDDPLTGGTEQASYFIDLHVGNPPQRLRVDPDTGSSQFVVVTPSCGCSYYGSGYDPSKSVTAVLSSCGGACSNRSSPSYLSSCQACSSFACGTCTTQVQYGDGSKATGSAYREVVHLPSLGDVPIFVGAMTSSSGKFSSFRDDGILGLAFPSLAAGIPTFMDQLAATGVPNVFSACYGKYDGGVMTFGGYDPSLVANGSFAISVPISSASGYFGVTVDGFSMGASTYSTAGLYDGGILDTGTTLLITRDAAFVQTFRSWFSSAASATPGAGLAQRLVDDPNHFACLSAAELASFIPCLPPLRIRMRDVSGTMQSVDVPASSYVWITESSSCPDYSVALGVTYAPFDLGSVDMILGDVLLRGLHTTYDRAAKVATFRQPIASLCGTGLGNITDSAVCGARPYFFGLPLWAIATIAAGGIVVVATLIIILCCCCCRRKKKQIYTEVGKDSHVQHAHERQMAPY